jgi:hypothetical protein
MVVKVEGLEKVECQKCKSVDNLVYHHIKYDPEEIIVLCKKCHRKEHTHYGKVRPENFKSKTIIQLYFKREGKLRPEVDEQLIKAVKVKYPNETALLGIAETVEWALKTFLGNN